MSGAPTNRGGAPVGYLHELDELEVSAVLYMRHWCSGPEHQAAVWNDFARVFGASEGRRQLGHFEALMSTLVEHGRRPLMRHGACCRCLGADESVFANMIGAAGQGEREEAAIMASLLVRPDMATTVAILAEQVGLSLRRLAMRAAPRSFATTSEITHPSSTLSH